jgi:3-hexulose-6-phosphate synthase/6-phospho-3-hexuloisomerase
MPKLIIEPPVVQVAIDVLTIDAALRVAEAAVKAGADWLEAGTPLITFAGVAAIGALAKAFPGVPVLADYKIMDGAKKYVIEAGRQGGRLATVCGQAHDATVRAAVAGGREAGVAVICDLYNAPDVATRAAEIEALGIDSVYVHWGSDARVELPDRDPLRDLAPTLERVSVPVGVGTFSVADGVRAFSLGADIGVIGMPLIQSEDIEGVLRAYIEQGKAAYRRRGR